MPSKTEVLNAVKKSIEELDDGNLNAIPLRTVIRSMSSSIKRARQNGSTWESIALKIKTALESQFDRKVRLSAATLKHYHQNPGHQSKKVKKSGGGSQSKNTVNRVSESDSKEQPEQSKLTAENGSKNDSVDHVESSVVDKSSRISNSVKKSGSPGADSRNNSSRTRFNTRHPIKIL